MTMDFGPAPPEEIRGLEEQALPIPELRRSNIRWNRSRSGSDELLNKVNSNVGNRSSLPRAQVRIGPL